MITTSNYVESKKDFERLAPIRHFSSSDARDLQTTANKNLKALSKKALISQKMSSNQDLSERQIQTLNDTFHWQIARINALLNTILVNNIVTEKDSHQIKNYRKNLTAIQNELEQLKQDHKLTDKQMKQALSFIQQAQETVQDINTLIAKLGAYNTEGAIFDTCCDSVIDQSYAPQSGDPLLSMKAMRDSIVSLDKMSRIILPLQNKDQTSSTKLLSLFNADMRHFSWIAEDWSESIEEACQTLLKDLSKLDRSQDKASQYEALTRHLQKMQDEVKQIHNELQDHQAFDQASNRQIKENLDSILSSLENAQKALSAAHAQSEEQFQKLQRETRSKAFQRIDYGDKTWQELARHHSSHQPPTWLMKKIQDVTNVQEWSETTKDVVYRLFTLMQLDPATKIAGAYDLLSGEYNANLKKMAHILQEQAFRSIPPETIKDIEYETATLGTLLMFNYKVIHHSKTLEQLTHKCPDIRETLQSVIDQFGSTPPNQDQVRELVDSYRMERLLKASSLSSPYYDRVFSTPVETEKEKADPADAEQKSSAVQLVKDIKVEDMTSAAPSRLGSIPFAIMKGFKAVQTALNWSTHAQESSISQAPLVNHIQQQTYVNLTAAISKVERIEEQLKEIQGPDLTLLHEETALIHRELLYAIANTPPPSCQLLELAQWTQLVEDHCSTLELVESRLAALEAQTLAEKEKMTSTLENPVLALHEEKVISLLSHLWELKGVAHLKKKQTKAESFEKLFELEGETTPFYLGRYIKYTLQSYAKANPNALSGIEHALLQKVFNLHFIHPGSFTKDVELNQRAQKIFSQIQTDQLALISTGWGGHSTVIVIMGPYFMFCNRGEGTVKPIEIYKIDPTKITVDIIKELQWKLHAEFSIFFAWTLAKIDAQQDELCTHFENLNPLRPTQFSGNCMWESMETATFGIIALQRMLTQRNEGNVFKFSDIIEKTYIDFQGWLQNTKIDSLENYLFRTEKQDSFYLKNLEILSAIFQQKLEETKDNQKQRTSIKPLDELSRQLIPQTYDDFLIERAQVFDQYAWKLEAEKKFETIKTRHFAQFPSLKVASKPIKESGLPEQFEQLLAVSVTAAIAAATFGVYYQLYHRLVRKK